MPVAVLGPLRHHATLAHASPDAERKAHEISNRMIRPVWSACHNEVSGNGTEIGVAVPVIGSGSVSRCTTPSLDAKKRGTGSIAAHTAFSASAINVPSVNAGELKI